MDGEMKQKPKKGIFTLSHPCMAVRYIYICTIASLIMEQWCHLPALFHHQHPTSNHLGEMNKTTKKGIFTLSHPCMAVCYVYTIYTVPSFRMERWCCLPALFHR